MRPRVKTRISVAMTALVAVNLLTAAVSWNYVARAARLSEAARESSAQARASAQAAHRVSRFVSDANSLALTVVRSGVSEDISTRYGEIQGSELASDHALRALRTGGGDSEKAYEQWEKLRVATYFWINREAEIAGADLRLTRDAQGRYRASVRSNLKPDSDLVGLDAAGLRNAAHARSKALVDGSLRRHEIGSETEAAAAAAQGDEARALAARATLALVALSLVTAIAAAVWLYRSIAAPLERARNYAQHVAAGALDATYTAHTDDEIGSLTHAVEDMKNAVMRRIDTMKEMAGVVLVTAEEVDQAARHALHGAQSSAVGIGVEDDVAEVVFRAGILSELATQMIQTDSESPVA